MDELRAEKAPPPSAPYVPGAYERRLGAFVSARIDEAMFADAWHTLPDDVPINQQPFWKTKVWLQFLAGRDEGVKQSR